MQLALLLPPLLCCYHVNLHLLLLRALLQMRCCHCQIEPVLHPLLLLLLF